MNSFEEATLRLKQQLGKTQEKEVAELLGMSPQAWAGRKVRGTFPSTEVFALAAKRPEFGLDPNWIVTGTSPQMVPANNSEASLLRAYRLLPTDVQRDLTRLMITLAGPAYHEQDHKPAE